MVDVTGSDNSGATLLQIEQGFQGSNRLLSVQVNPAGLRLTWMVTATTVFSPALPAGRNVVHVLVDTTLPDNQRVMGFVNGLALNGLGEPNAGSTLNLGLNNIDLTVGNDANSAESIQGTLFYAAIYDRRLTPAEITAHVAVLSADDDTP